MEEDITRGQKSSVFGRKDTPSVEQIVRAAIYKELKGLEYRQLEYHQTDSRICECNEYGLMVVNHHLFAAVLKSPCQNGIMKSDNGQ